MIHLYDNTTIHEIAWPQNEDGLYAKKFLTPLIEEGIRHYIDNVEAQLYVLKVGESVFPVVVVTENYKNSWVCSPYAHYIAYGEKSVDLVKNSMASAFIRHTIHALGKMSRIAKMNSIVYVNNWLFSTDLYPRTISYDNVGAIVELLTKRFPDHLIAFRSLNSLTEPKLMELLKKQKFQLLASRYVFVTDGKDESILKTRIVKSDLRLLEKSTFRIVEENDLTLQECDRLLDLYRLLYIDQHSDLQPQFNYNYMRLLFEKNLLRFKVIKDLSGEIRGLAGYYKRDNVMMCPIFGYDKNSPDSNTIYRLLNMALLNESHKQGLSFNQSAGASFFKSIRRAVGSQEYMCIYFKHLPLYRKFFWSTLKFFINMVGPHYMKKYK